MSSIIRCSKLKITRLYIHLNVFDYQIFQAQSYPIVCSYDDNGIDMPDGIQDEVDHMISRSHFRSSSSENEAEEELDSPNEMTILRPRVTRRKIRISSDKSYGKCNGLIIFWG